MLAAEQMMGVGLASARLLSRSRPGRRLVSTFAAAGAVTLTPYALQILWLAYDARVLHPDQRDDSWTNLAVLVVGSLLVSGGWHAVVRR